MNKSWTLQSTECEEGTTTVDASKTLDYCEGLNPFCRVVVLGNVHDKKNAQYFRICMQNIVTMVSLPTEPHPCSSERFFFIVLTY